MTALEWALWAIALASLLAICTGLLVAVAREALRPTPAESTPKLCERNPR